MGNAKWPEAGPTSTNAPRTRRCFMNTYMKLRPLVKKVPFAISAYAVVRLMFGRNARFTRDYRENSGVGSDLEATRAVSVALPGLVESLSVRRMLDIPCGDFLWMRHVD